ncbi:MAG: PaaI family thioesterase [Pseudomonadota bacterium]
MAPLTGAVLVERLNATQTETAKMFKQHVLEADPDAGKVIIEYTPDKRFCNPMGVVQGGFVAAMLDEAAAIACIVHAQKPIGVPTLEMKVSYFRPVLPGRVIVTGQIVKQGRKVTFLGADMHDDAGKALAQASLTSMPTG